MQSTVVRLDPAFKPKQKRDLFLREAEGETMLFDPQTMKVHVFNETTRFIWDQCASGRKTAAGISHRLARHYQISTECALKDTMTVLQKFSTLGLLV